MPPKSKSKSQEDDDSPDLLIQEKLIKAQLEIENLQRELEIKNEINARLRQQLFESKERTTYLESQMETRAKDRIDLMSDMARQFKIMQGELVSEVNRLENTTFELQTKLVGVQNAFTEAKQEHASVLNEKEAALEEVNLKMAYMTAELENMLTETLGKITKKLDVVSTRWKESDNITLSEQNARRLDDFQLTRLALGTTRRF